ncbi:hypothetical protein [Aeromonas schubertii]|uniref:Uncharacterized protein n=1 Tax=Aeromonas schubertii TaxID=652 RepID=A0A0S2SKA4_9GAMM|nr:hypothetical protein [Aeromonas schubertii]ALP42131.1 hypothetical protein WL1483_2712 [Aeromonas schubertii]
MKTALLLIASWLLTLLPTERGVVPLLALLLDADRELYGTGQLTGLAGILLTLYLANLGVEVVLRRRFQIAGMLTLVAAWIEFINQGAALAPWWQILLPALPFLGISLLVLLRGIQAFGRQKG